MIRVDNRLLRLLVDPAQRPWKLKLYDLTAYRHDPSPEMASLSVRHAMLVLPGGVYASTGDREADPIALSFLAHGFHAFVVCYSVAPFAAFPNSLCAASRAVERPRRRTMDGAVHALVMAPVRRAELQPAHAGLRAGLTA